MASHTVKDIQEALVAKGFDPGEIDGQLGPKTSEALKAYQSVNPSLSATGQPDEPTLKALFPSASPTGPRTLKSSLIDYVLNGVTSKINGVAAVMVATLAAWVTTKFGFEVSPDIQNAVTMLLVTAFGALIAMLRTFFLNPHVTTKQPAVVKNPSEVK